MAFLSGAVGESFVREVSTTPEEFERMLRKAWPAGVRTEGRGDAAMQLALADGPLQLSIVLEPIADLRIGLLSLPRLIARYRFQGGDAAARLRLLEQLDRAMQRGGG